MVYPVKEEKKKKERKRSPPFLNYRLMRMETIMFFPPPSKVFEGFLSAVGVRLLKSLTGTMPNFYLQPGGKCQYFKHGSPIIYGKSNDIHDFSHYSCYRARANNKIMISKYVTFAFIFRASSLLQITFLASDIGRLWKVRNSLKQYTRLFFRIARAARWRLR